MNNEIKIELAGDYIYRWAVANQPPLRGMTVTQLRAEVDRVGLPINADHMSKRNIYKCLVRARRQMLPPYSRMNNRQRIELAARLRLNPDGLWLEHIKIESMRVFDGIVTYPELEQWIDHYTERHKSHISAQREQRAQQRAAEKAKAEAEKAKAEAEQDTDDDDELEVKDEDTPSSRFDRWANTVPIGAMMRERMERSGYDDITLLEWVLGLDRNDPMQSIAARWLKMDDAEQQRLAEKERARKLAFRELLRRLVKLNPDPDFDPPTEFEKWLAPKHPMRAVYAEAERDVNILCWALNLDIGNPHREVALAWLQHEEARFEPARREYEAKQARYGSGSGSRPRNGDDVRKAFNTLGWTQLELGEPSKMAVRQRYRSLALQHHPDKAGGDETKFKRLSAAYELLMKRMR